MTLYKIFIPFTVIFSLTLAVFVLLNNPRSRANVTWFLASTSVAIWAFFFFLVITTADEKTSLISAKICNVAVAFISAFLVDFCYSITKKRNNTLLVISYCCALFITYIASTDYFLTVRKISIFNFYAKAKPGFYFFTLYFFGFFFVQAIHYLKSLKSQTPQKANQIKYILSAISVGYIAGILSFLPVYDVSINPITTNFIWMYAAIISYAIVRHQLMDIRIVVRQSFIYTSLVAVLTAIYAICVVTLGLMFNTVMGDNSIASTLISFTLIAILFKPIEHKIQSFADLLIFKRNAETLRIENQKLLEEIQKQDKLKAVAALAAGMAHEIKNPLTTIRTFAEYLPKRFDDPEFRKRFSDVVVEEADRMNSIVQQLLDFSKPKEPEIHPLELSALVQETLSLLSNNLLQNRIEVTQQIDAGLSVSADRGQLKQVLINLFLNAIQAMSNGGTLKVSAGRASESEVVLTVEDTGPGIPKEHLSHIFDPFFTTKESGTGLGLAVVHGIVTRHGGRIKAENAAAGGARFSVFLRN